MKGLNKVQQVFLPFTRVKGFVHLETAQADGEQVDLREVRRVPVSSCEDCRCERDMDDPGGSWLELGSPLQAAEAANASLATGPGIEVSGQIQMVLEILMVLMCLGAVTGTYFLDIYQLKLLNFSSILT